MTAEVRALLVTTHAEVSRVFEAALAETTDSLLVVHDMSGAVALASQEQPALVFIDMTLPAGTGLALVHHVLATHPRASIVALAPPAALEAAAEALSLGASGLLLAPPDGDAILRCIADVRARRSAEDAIARVTAERGALLDQAEAMTRAVVVARTGDSREIAEALLALFVLASGARGAAFFGPESDQGMRARLASYGSALELRDRYEEAELSQAASARGAALHVFGPLSRSLGCVLLDRADPNASERTASALGFANALLMISARAAASIPPPPGSRVVPEGQFARYLERALEEGKPLLVLSLSPPPTGRVDTTKLPLVDEGSLCSQRADGGAWLLYPARSALEGYRLLLMLGARGAGFAASPAEGRSAKDLLALADARATEARRSPYFDLPATGPTVGDLATSLLRSASLESRVSSLFPLELSMASLQSLLAHTFRQALRAPRTAQDPPIEIYVAHADPARSVEVVAQLLEQESLTATLLDVRGAPGCDSLDIVVLLTPRAAWAVCGRWEKDRLRAIHTCDPVACAALAQRVARAKETVR